MVGVSEVAGSPLPSLQRRRPAPVDPASQAGALVGLERLATSTGLAWFGAARAGGRRLWLGRATTLLDRMIQGLQPRVVEGSPSSELLDLGFSRRGR